MSVTTVLVTGAAGFIGRRLLERLSEQFPDAFLVGLDRDVGMPPCDLHIVCDLNSAHAFQSLQALRPIDYVIHLAAQSYVHSSMIRPDHYVRDNVLATSSLVQALSLHTSLKRFLLVSSCEVYGNTDEPASEDNDVKPRTPYAASKLAQEFVALAAIVHQQLPTVVCRLFNNYGRGQQGNRLIPRIMQALENDRPFELIGDGSQTRDWISLEDTCDALIALLVGADVGVGEIYNITSEEAYSVSQVLAMCEAMAKKNILVNQCGKDLGHLERSAGTADKLRAATGWRTQRDLESFIASLF